MGTILPKSSQGEIKQNKGSILKASVDYIKSLKLELNRSKQVEEKLRQMALLNRKLISRIRELEQKNESLNNTSNDDILHVKQEPQVTLRNLVTATRSPAQIFLHQHQQQAGGNYLLSPDQFHSPQANHSFQGMNGMAVLSEAMISDETFSPPGHEPLMCSANNVYGEQLMDALNGF